MGVASAPDTRDCAMCGVAANVPPLVELSHSKLPQSQPNRATNEHPTLHVPDAMIVSRDGDSAVHSGAVRLRRGRMRMTLYMNGATASAGPNGAQWCGRNLDTGRAGIMLQDDRWRYRSRNERFDCFHGCRGLSAGRQTPRMTPQCKPHSTPTGGCRGSDRSRLAWPERFEASQLRGPRNGSAWQLAALF